MNKPVLGLLVLILTCLGGCNSSSSSYSAGQAANTVNRGTSGNPQVDPELGPLISGTASYVDGQYVWTDYVYDDRGSNSDGTPGGDASYPEPPHPGNTADLVQLQLATDARGSLTVSAILQTLVDGHDVLLGVGFDTDSNNGTGAASLPGEQWANDSNLGLEELVLLYSNGTGRVLSWIGGQWLQTGSIAVEVDRERNALAATITTLKPEGQSWLAVAAAGPADGNAGWADGSDAIYDLAFVHAEDPVTDPAFALQEQVPQIQRPWQDKIQADILAGNAAAELAIATVAFGTGNTELATTGPGLHTFLYHSRLKLEEGIRPDPLQYRGLYLPYVVMIPDGLPDNTQAPAIIFMHGSDQNHLVNAVHFSSEGIAISGFYHVPAIVIFPMGRDPNWNTGLSEQDLLDTTADAVARLNLDEDRLILSGISAGGIGTFRHAARYPDRWNGGYSIVGGGTAQLENLRNLPLRAHNGLLDPLVDVSYWQASADALAATTGVDYRTALIHTSSHLPSPLGNCWYLELVNTPRQVNPARVTYTVNPADYFVDADIGLDLRPRSAYWLLELLSRNDEPATADIISLARPDRTHTSTDIDEYGSSITGADFCGPNPDIVGPDTWQLLGRSQTLDTTPAATSNGMELTLSGAASLLLDTERMALDSSLALSIHSQSDGETQLVLKGDWQGAYTLNVSGQPGMQLNASDDTLTLTLATGDNSYILEPR